MNFRAQTIPVLTLLMLLVSVCFTGCEALEEAAETGRRVVEENPELIDEEDRGAVLAGLRSVGAMLGEIDTREEIAMGQALAVRTFSSFGRPHPDQRLQRYVSKVGNLVALQSERPGLPYSFAVVQNTDTTALALPGGYVFVSSGLLQQLNSESELAAILAHEVAHVARKHGLEISLRDRRISSLLNFAGELDEDMEQYREFIDKTYDKLARQGYDQRYEIKADLAGTAYAYRAGYHPEGLLPFLQRSAKSNGQISFEAFKTHPDPRQRIREIQNYLDRLGTYTGSPLLTGRYETQCLARLN